MDYLAVTTQSVIHLTDYLGERQKKLSECPLININVGTLVIYVIGFGTNFLASFNKMTWHGIFRSTNSDNKLLSPTDIYPRRSIFT